MVLYYSEISFIWLYSGVVSTEEHRGGLSHESLPSELCELWPWGPALGSGLLGWSCSFVELAWTEKRYGEERLQRYVAMPDILKLNFPPNAFSFSDSVRSSEFSAESVFLSLLLHIVLRLSVRRSAALVSGSSCLCGQLSCSPRLHAVTELPAGRKPFAECWTWQCGEDYGLTFLIFSCLIFFFCTLTGILKHSALRYFLLSRLMCGPVVLGDLSLYWERKRYFHVLKLELMLILV